MNIQNRTKVMKKNTAKFSMAAMSLCLILSFQALNSIFAYANPIDDKASQLVCWGAPESPVTKSDQYLIRTTYAVHYLYRRINSSHRRNVGHCSYVDSRVWWSGAGSYEFIGLWPDLAECYRKPSVWNYVLQHYGKADIH